VPRLYDKYGYLVRNSRRRNFRLIKPYQDDDLMCRVDGRFKPQKELLWKGTGVYGVVTCSFVKGTGVYGVVTCSFVKSSSPKTIACEMEEKFRI
jgi:hypothetical protein